MGATDIWRTSMCRRLCPRLLGSGGRRESGRRFRCFPGERQRDSAGKHPKTAEEINAEIQGIKEKLTGEFEENLKYFVLKLICRLSLRRAAIISESSANRRMELRPVGEAGGSLRGIFMLSSYMAKGLEFDAVIVCDADSANYSRERCRP